MLPDDDSYRQTQQLRKKELLLALILGLATVTSSICYILFLRQLGTVYLSVIISMDALVMFGVYLLLVSKMRKRGR